MSKRNLSSGFTLIELLVVMSLIAVLVSILMPVLSRVMRQEQALICAANERTLLGATTAYAADNSGFLPVPSFGWDGLAPGYGPNCAWAMDAWGIADFQIGTLWPYVAASRDARAKVMWCPADDTECYPTLSGNLVVVARNFTYSFNANIRTNWTPTTYYPAVTLPLRRIVNPSQHVMIYEEFGPNDGMCCGPTDLDDWLTGRHGPIGATQYRSSYGNPIWRNDGMGNVGYFDGHVALVSVNYYFAPTPLGSSNWYHFGPLTQ